MTGVGGRDQQLKILSLFSIFKDCDRQTLLSLLRDGAWTDYDAGETVFLQGEECNLLLIVVSGAVRLSLASESGRELILAERGPGCILGDVELILKRRRLTDGLASEPTRLFALRRASVARMLDNPTFSLALLEAVCAGWCRLLRVAEAMSLHSLEQRLAALLLDLLQTHGRPVVGGTLIDRAMSQTRMAQLINASRPKVNTQLHAWNKTGIISLKRNIITILSQDGLENIAERSI